jgi:hypothetical protein
MLAALHTLPKGEKETGPRITIRHRTAIQDVSITVSLQQIISYNARFPGADRRCISERGNVCPL